MMRPWTAKRGSQHSTGCGNSRRCKADYVISVRGDVLEEIDGPMLRHGLQGSTDSSSSCLATQQTAPTANA